MRGSSREKKKNRKPNSRKIVGLIGGQSKHLSRSGQDSHQPAEQAEALVSLRCLLSEYHLHKQMDHGAKEVRRQ